MKVNRTGAEDCWEWSGATNELGYGVLHPSGRRSGPSVKAHRYSAELAGVDIKGRFVLHSCDNPPCVNPRHLRPGNHIENVADMTSRGRVSRGETSGTNKLTESDVKEIRQLAARGIHHKELAVQFQVSRSNISRIVNQKGWAHVA